MARANIEDVRLDGDFPWKLPALGSELLDGSQPPPAETYRRLVQARWHQLINSQIAGREDIIQRFLEHHPALLPGPFSLDGRSGHAPYPYAVISQPPLRDLSSRIPDFMWLATDSDTVYPILIEIETPTKRWFHEAGSTLHSDFTQAQGQLTEWRSWFRKGANLSWFADTYLRSDPFRRRRLDPRFVLIHGRRSEYQYDEERVRKKAEARGEGERLMSFDRLEVDPDACDAFCVRMTPSGYRAIAVPPSFRIHTYENVRYSDVVGLAEAIDAATDISSTRKELLNETLAELIARSQVKGGSGEPGGMQVV